MNSNNKKNRLTGVSLWMYILITFAGISTSSVVWYGFSVGIKAITVHAPLIDAVMEIKLEVTIAHLWLEEIVSGDRNDNLDVVIAHLDLADWYADAMLNGGQNSKGTFIPLDNEEARQDIITVQKSLKEFRAITEQRYAEKDISGTVSEIYQRYNKIHNSFIDSADAAEIKIQQVIAEELNTLQNMQVILLFASMLLALFVGASFYNVERHRAKDFLVIQNEVVERKKAEKMLVTHQEKLEHLVSERTKGLEIVTTISEKLAAILDFDQLLVEMVNQVKDSFGYYHAHVYIIDDSRQNLIMTAGAGEAGKQIKAKGHFIPIGVLTSLVARSARTKEIVRVDNVREAADWLPNPLLPNTYSEMSVPIILDGEVVGVLDVQEDKIAGLDDGDAHILRSLANQVAIAIRNTRLFAEVEQALKETKTAQDRYIEQAWNRDKLTRRNLCQAQFSHEEATILNEATIIEAREQAFAQKEPTMVKLNGADSSEYALVAPIILQEKAIGSLQLHKIDPDRKWTEGELAFINAILDQTAQIGDSLRLFDDVQERGQREQLVSQISDKLRRATDLDSLIKIGMEELSLALDTERTFIRLGSERELVADGGEKKNGA